MSIEKTPEANSLSTADDEPPGTQAGCSPTRLTKVDENAENETFPASPAITRLNRFPQSDTSRAFRKLHFPGISSADWNSWQWQICNVLKTPQELMRIFRLTRDEHEAISGGTACQALPTAITPYYASLINPDDPADPIRRTMIPTTNELRESPGEAADPLGEDNQSPIPGLVHRYPDRVLFLATEYCSAYCRYCTRSRLVGQQERQRYRRKQWEIALDYIRSTPAIRDVILSGGDPLTLPDEALEWLLVNIRAIKHVEVIRIGTKTPAVLPMRITPVLTKIIRRVHPVWMSLHFTHPGELTPETTEACSRLADAGAPLGSQTVLLKGINDHPDAMRPLMTGLMKIRVRPYYIYQCDPILGSSHFRTPVARGIEMIEALRGHVSGYAVPHYVVDAPGGGGKIPLIPEYARQWENGDLTLRNYQNKEFHYPDLEA